jgi:predicted MFS family arabinose efflux permease
MSTLKSPVENTLRSPWWISVGSFIALIVVNGSICVFSFGVFIKPLEAEFGWDRASISFGLTLCALGSAIALPIAGGLMDKFGLRPVMLTSIVLFALNVAAIALSNVLAVFILLVAATGITGVGQGPTGYIKGISSYFDKQRGIAIGIAVSGTGLGTALLPQYAQWLITNMGWRVAYVGLAVVLVVIAVPAVFLFVREPEDSPMVRARRAASGAAVLPGFSVREALSSRDFWLLVGATISVATVVNGSLVHVVSLLTDRGWSPEAAAGIMVWAGLASLGGRVIAGLMLDRVFGPYVAMLSFTVALAGVYLLASGTNPTLGVVGIGITTGAEIDIIGYMTSRYFGLRRFGQLYGYLFGVFLIGTGIGAAVMGAVQARLHSYDSAFYAFGIMLALAIFFMLFLGRYACPVGEGEDLVDVAHSQLSDA